MNKNELIAKVAEKNNVSKRVAEEVINAMLEEILDAMNKGETVKISGFGTFQVRARKGRVGTSPNTHEKINIEPTKNVTFKASRVLKKDL